MINDNSKYTQDRHVGKYVTRLKGSFLFNLHFSKGYNIRAMFEAM